MNRNRKYPSTAVDIFFAKSLFFAEAKIAPSSGAKESRESCRILEEYGIDLNLAANNFVTTEAMHNGGHSNMYHINIRDVLISNEQDAMNMGLSNEVVRNMICKQLQEIREELLKVI